MRRAVVDQPGIRIIAIGLVLSIFLGLALRSQISDTRIEGYLNKATNRLQKDFFVDFESAKVNLSRWGLPLPTLVIQNIRLSSKNPLCQNSQIFIEELEVPISPLTILGYSKSIPKVRINELELRLSDIEICLSSTNLSNSEVNSETNSEVLEESKAIAPKSSSKVKLDNEKLEIEKNRQKANQVLSGEPKEGEGQVKNIFLNDTKADLKEITIEKLKIISNKNPSQPVFLKQINIELLYSQNHLAEVQVKSKLNALKDARSEVYFLNANLNAFFKAKENNEMESVIKLNGKLLDGDIQFFAHSFTGSDKVSYELALDKVSARALAPITSGFLSDKNENNTNENNSSTQLNFERYINFEKAPVSISLNNTGNVFLSKKSKIISKFSNVLIHIENGQLKIGEIELDYMDSKLLIKPFSLSISALPLSKLKTIEPFKNKLDSFETLGTLSGFFDYTNETAYKMKGEIKNIQVVFSNRGRRDLQNVERVGVEIARNANELKLGLTDFIINNEEIDGELRGRYDFFNYNIQAQLKMSGVTLNPNIWEQFTFVEQSPKIDFIWNYSKLKQEIHNIKIGVEELALPGVQLTNLNIDINQIFSELLHENKLNVNIKPNKIIGDQNFLNHKLVNQILIPKYGFKLSALNSIKTSLVINGRDWKNVEFILESYFLSDPALKADTHLSLKGDINAQKGLKAQLVLQNRKSNFKFDFYKNNDEEILIKNIE